MANAVGILLVKERQVLVPIGEPRRYQPMARDPQLDPLGREQEVEPREHSLQHRNPFARFGFRMLVQQDHVRPARHLGLDPQRLAEGGQFRISHGRSSRSSRATIRAVGPCFGSIAWSSRSSAATSIVSPFSMAHHTAAYRAANPPGRASDVAPPTRSPARNPAQLDDVLAEQLDLPLRHRQNHPVPLDRRRKLGIPPLRK